MLIIFFYLSRKEDSRFDWTEFERIVREMHEQTDKDLDMLSKMSKQKDKIEEKIRDKKKKLGMSLVDKK